MRKQYDSRFREWNRKVKAIKTEINKTRSLLRVEQELRSKKKKKKSEREIQLRSKLKNLVQLRTRYTSQVDKMTDKVMPVAYENYLGELEETERSVNRDLIPINLAIIKYKQAYRNLQAYREKKEKDYVKNILEKRYEKRINKLEKEMKKRVPSVPKTAPIISAPQKQYVHPISTCINISWKAIPEKNISGYTIIAYILMPDGKYKATKVGISIEIAFVVRPKQTGPLQRCYSRVNSKFYLQIPRAWP